MMMTLGRWARGLGSATVQAMVKRMVHLRWIDRLAARLAEEGTDRRYGARPLQRTLERMVATPLSRFPVARPGCGTGRSPWTWGWTGR
jgi:hypothetical protein